MAPESSERCGYRLEIGLPGQDFPTEPCSRPAWEDYDRCVWHAPVDGKTAGELTAEGEPGDDLDGAYLKEASLVGVDWLAGMSLVGADLTDADVNGVDFSDADLTLATLTSVSAINADFTGANLEGAIFTNADIRRATLVDARLNEAVFTDVHIDDGTVLGQESVYDGGSVRPKLSDDPPLAAAAWTYREFQQIYKENALPGAARDNYNREKDARRRLAWSQADYAPAIKWELSRWVMNYGSSPYRVLLVSLVVIVISAVLFPLTGGIQEVQGDRAITYTVDDPQAVPTWWLGQVLLKSFYFSVITFATLGYGDIQPIGTSARMLAGIETILGSLLSALLVFVLARSVTW
ncbi:ion transporter [Halobacteriales archaeon QS_1_68_20]|nr:MAG: ion transporter [Halobacteriales archaeon QS_1_68_20]